ncbi:MAG: GNAT family N-acetyltransferase [Gemmatimonadota bacterium]|nr:GNAT family N-acetyltransferase [Gemmatimonadota bacterium]
MPTTGAHRARPRLHGESRLEEIRRLELPGYGTLRETGERFRFSIRVLDSTRIADVVALQSEVLTPLEPPLPLYVRDRAFFERCIRGVGCVVGAFHANRLIAYATLNAPARGQVNLGVTLGLPDEDLPYVAHLAGSAVDPAYRGNRLQPHLVELRDEFARQAGFEHLCGEVVPVNSVSIRNHLAVGYLLKAFRIDGLGDPNFVLDKALQLGPPMMKPCEIRETPTDDIEGFRRMIAEGRWGFRTAKRSSGTVIEYGRFA